MKQTDDFADLYQEVILDHGRKPRHGKRLEEFDVTAKGDNPMCGDRVQVWDALREAPRSGRSRGRGSALGGQETGQQDAAARQHRRRCGQVTEIASPNGGIPGHGNPMFPPSPPWRHDFGRPAALIDRRRTLTVVLRSRLVRYLRRVCVGRGLSF